MKYYYVKSGESLGPLPIDDLVKIIDGNTLIWNEDGSMTDWLPAQNVEEVWSKISSIHTANHSINSSAQKINIPEKNNSSNTSMPEEIQENEIKYDESSNVLLNIGGYIIGLLILAVIAGAIYFFSGEYNSDKKRRQDEEEMIKRGERRMEAAKKWEERSNTKK